MKEYSRPEVFEVSVASGIANEGLNLGVISFADGIGYWIQSVAEQSFQMLLKHVGYLGKRFEFKAADPSSPMIEEGASLPWAAELPELGKGLLGRPRFGDLQIELLDHVKHLLVILAPVATTAKEKVFGSLQPVFALIGQLFALSSAYLVNRLIEVLGVVKAVVHNPGLRSVQRGRVQHGRVHRRRVQRRRVSVQMIQLWHMNRQRWQRRRSQCGGACNCEGSSGSSRCGWHHCAAKVFSLSCVQLPILLLR